jgi:hypothetical protein
MRKYHYTQNSYPSWIGNKSFHDILKRNKYLQEVRNKLRNKLQNKQD